MAMWYDDEDYEFYDGESEGLDDDGEDPEVEACTCGDCPQCEEAFEDDGLGAWW